MELKYMTMKRAETDVQNFSPWEVILASLFALANDWELAIQIWKSSSLRWMILKAKNWKKTELKIETNSEHFL